MPKKSVTPVQKLLRKIRPAWINRVGQELARGMEVRADFEEQLGRFFDLVEQAVTTGDPAWLEPILLDWAKSPTETDLESGLYHVAFVMNRIIALTIETARDILTKQQALDLLAYVIPVYTYGLEVVARYEMETRVAHISKEMETVQKKLEKLDRSKSAFISVAAHELKTPLTLIDGYAAMLGDMVSENHDKNIDYLMNGMNTGLRRLRSILDDMIDVSMIDNNLLAINYQPIWVNHLLDGLRREFEHTARERKLHLEIKNFQGSDQKTYADSVRIMQAVRNILLNAIKYTPDGGSITVDGRTLPGFIEITVTDTGIGISPEDQAVIFEKFSQLGRTELHSSGKTKFKGGGPGLGLPITRGIIEAHGGSIWVESEGHDEKKCPGSTFHILLPLRSESPDPKLTKLFSNLEPLPNETYDGKKNPSTNKPAA